MGIFVLSYDSRVIVPANTDLTGTVGASWDMQFDLWQDIEQTEALIVETTYDVSQTRLVMDDLAVLTPGQAFNVDPQDVITENAGLTFTAPNVFYAELPPSITGLAVAACFYRLALVRLGTGGIDVVLSGLIHWSPTP